MPTVIMKHDAVMEKIRNKIKNFKEDIMENANLKLKIWEEQKVKE